MVEVAHNQEHGGQDGNSDRHDKLWGLQSTGQQLSVDDSIESVAEMADITPYCGVSERPIQSQYIVQGSPSLDRCQ